MTASLVQELAQLIALLRGETEHNVECNRRFYEAGIQECSCGWQARVDAAIAARWAASIDAATLVPLSRMVNPVPESRSRWDIDEEAREAALQAARVTPP